MKSKIYYTAIEVYDSQTGNELNLEKYIEWSKLTHLKELVSLDGLLNRLVFKPDFESKDDWKYIVNDGKTSILFFNSIDYVLEKIEGLKHFNFLAVIKEPKKEKVNLNADFEFVGYDLIEKEGNISALTNCGGFDETFSPTDLNQYGLVSNFEKVKIIQTELPKNNPESHHADCYLYEIWRHKTIGRKEKRKA